MQQRLFAADAPRYSGGTVSTATPKPTSAPARPTATAKPSADLRYGDTGTAVRALQNRLKSLGYLTGSVDGIYGTDTRNAVMKFEAAYGRAQTGVATEAMQEVLYSDNARTYQQALWQPGYAHAHREHDGELHAIKLWQQGRRRAALASAPGGIGLSAKHGDG